MATEMARTKPEDTASRISVLESQVEDISADVIPSVSRKNSIY